MGQDGWVRSRGRFIYDWNERYPMDKAKNGIERIETELSNPGLNRCPFRV